PAAVLLAETGSEGLGLAQHGVEDATAPLQGPPLPCRAALRLLEQLAEDDARVPLCRQLNAVGTVRQPMALVAQLERGEARLRRRHRGHELVDGDGVPLRRPDLTTGEPDGAAVVMMPEPVRMVEPADWRDVGPVLFHRREDLGELVPRAR